MTALALNINVDFSRSGKQGAVPAANCPSRQAWIIMQAVEFIDMPLTGEKSQLVGLHAAALAFFSWLEEEQEVIAWLMFTKVAENTQSNRHMNVVPAGVHHAWVLGSIWQAGRLSYWQSVDIRPVADGPFSL